jgi:hypothetical protein
MDKNPCSEANKQMAGHDNSQQLNERPILRACGRMAEAEIDVILENLGGLPMLA